MFNLFNFKRPNRYTVIARHYSGSWMKQFSVAGYNPYEAARRFDNDPANLSWIRVSGATLK